MGESVEVSVRRRRSRSEAERLVLEFKQSGLTRQEFCARHGLSVAALDKYRRRSPASLPGRERLLPVELAPDQASALKTNSALWVELAGGRRIGVESGFDAVTFECVIRLLDKA
jgi:transcriptional regulator with XRE-family HTH domain